ncbi:AraC family transcriptional regulator [Ruegeria sp. HKCCA6837]|uniref:AraC family transcriptional regulator n=1 Tax=Ruegeria sp. HKCCA6837 TaxID=2682989 RepID=UPI0014880880|nr:AraC family transcriptional regulator [Ruegeria sp. HKCCA6837]
MGKTTEKKVIVPVVTSAMTQPFAAIALQSGADIDALLEPTGLSLKEIQIGEALMSGQKWYDFMQDLAEVIDDPFMGYHVGSQAAFESLPNLKNLETNDATLGNLLTSMVIEAESLTSLADYQLSVRGKQAELSSVRTFEPSCKPAQADGYFAGFLVQLTQLCCGSQWDAGRFDMSICDPSAIPREMRSIARVKQVSSKGVSFKFPAMWLLMANQGESNQKPIDGHIRQTDFMTSVSLLMELHLNDPSLTMAKFAKIASSTPNELKRHFAIHKTTFLTELDAHRRNRAVALLKSSNLPAFEIGPRVGFPDPSGFSRAFKRWTGTTPGKFRAMSKKE